MLHVVIADGDERSVKLYEPEYVMYFQDDCGKYKSIFGDKLAKFTTGSYFELRDAIEVVTEAGLQIFESDVDPLFRLLQEKFPSDDGPDLNVTIFDIEVDKDKDKTFATIENPYAEITAISMHNKWCDEKLALMVPPENLTVQECRDLLDGKCYQDDDGNIIEGKPLDDFGIMSEHDGYIIVETEEDLLRAFIELIADADVISGWNSNFFDVPYIIQRIRIVLGFEEIEDMEHEHGTIENPFNPSEESADWLKLLNRFDCLPTLRMGDQFGSRVRTYQLHGRIHLDYLDLYRKFTYVELHSYALDFILNHELGQSKVAYSGSLDQLYRNDFRRFSAYSYQDTMGLSAIDDKLKFITLANSLAHMAGVTMPTVLGTVSLIDQAILKELHRTHKRICFDKKDPDQPHTIPGAFVLDPHAGIYPYIASYDFNSLYPTVIRMLNLSPETIVGFVRPDETVDKVFDLIAGMNGDEDFLVKLPSQKRKAEKSAQAWSHFSGTIEYNRVINRSDETVIFDIEHTEDSVEISGADMHDLIIENNWLITAFGLVIEREPQGIVPYCMEKWYAQRVENKKLAKKNYEASKVDPENKEKLLVDSEYYNRIQMVLKILLNSSYGALLNKHSRFADIRMGSSVTMSGRICLATMADEAEQILDQEVITI